MSSRKPFAVESITQETGFEFAERLAGANSRESGQPGIAT